MILDDTFSHCSVDPSSVQVYPQCLPKVTISKEIVANDYIIWNTYGEVRYASPVPPLTSP